MKSESCGGGACDMFSVCELPDVIETHSVCPDSQWMLFLHMFPKPDPGGYTGHVSFTLFSLSTGHMGLPYSIRPTADC